MAGNDEDLDFDDLDFDFEEFDPKQTNNNGSKSIADAGKEIGREAWRNIADTREDRIKTASDIAGHAIPNALSEEYDLLSSSVSHAREEIGSAVDSTKKATTKFLKSLDKLTGPDSSMRVISDKLKNFLKTDDDESSGSYGSNGPSKEELLNSDIAAALADLNNITATSAQNNETISSGRHKESIGVQKIQTDTLSAIRDFHYTASSTFFKKSIELQVRHIFATKEHMTVSAAMSADMTKRLDAIIRNTAIADSAKLTTAETKAAMAAAEAANPAKSRSMFSTRPLMESIKKNISRKVGGIRSDIISGLDMAGMGVSTISDLMGEDSMLSPTQIIGGLLADEAKKRAGNYIGKKIEESKYSDDIIYKLKNMAADPNAAFSDIVNEGSRSSTLGNAKHTIFSFLRDITANDPTINNKNYLVSNQDTPTAYTKRTETAIEKVIPGLLTAIHAELKATRLNNNNPEQYSLTYDNKSSTFKTSAEIVADTKSNIKYSMSTRVKYDIESMVSMIIENAEHTFNTEQTTEIRKSVLSYVISVKSVAPDRLIHGNPALVDFISTPELKAPVMLAISKMLNRAKKEPYYFDTIRNTLKYILENIPNYTEYTDELYKSGDISTLRKLGVLKEPTVEERARGIAYKVDSAALTKLGMEALEEAAPMDQGRPAADIAPTAVQQIVYLAG